MFGHEAAMIDAGDYYIIQGDIHLSKEDIGSPQTRGARRLGTRIFYLDKTHMFLQVF